MLKSETKIVGDGLQVTVTQLQARGALKLAGKLGRVIGPALAKLPPGITTDSDLSALAPAFAAAVAELEDDAAYDALLLAILQSAQVEKEGRIVGLSSLPAIDSVFGADVGALIAACAFALSVNLKGFTSGLSSVPGAQAALKKTTTGA